MSEQDEIALLRAQLIQCTTAMREAGYKLQEWRGAEGVPDDGLVVEAEKLLYTARGTAIPDDQWKNVAQWRQEAEASAARIAGFAMLAEGWLDSFDAKIRYQDGDAILPGDTLNRVRNEMQEAAKAPHALEAIRAGEWQRASQEADKLRVDLYEARQQLETTQRALVEARESTDFPNKPLEEARREVARLREEEAELRRAYEHADHKAAQLEQNLLQLLTERDAWHEKCDNAEEQRKTSARAAAERYEALRGTNERNAEAAESYGQQLERVRKLLAICYEMAGGDEA